MRVRRWQAILEKIEPPPRVSRAVTFFKGNVGYVDDLFTAAKPAKCACIYSVRPLFEKLSVSSRRAADGAGVHQLAVAAPIAVTSAARIRS